MSSKSDDESNDVKNIWKLMTKLETIDQNVKNMNKMPDQRLAPRKEQPRPANLKTKSRSSSGSATSKDNIRKSSGDNTKKGTKSKDKDKRSGSNGAKVKKGTKETKSSSNSAKNKTDKTGKHVAKRFVGKFKKKSVKSSSPSRKINK